MAAPWPQWLTNSFLSANQPQFFNNGNAFYGPYTRLLYHLFGLEGPFEIIPQYEIPETLRDATDVIAMFTVEFNNQPVFFIDVKPPSAFNFDSRRKEADHEMRNRFLDLHSSTIIPRLTAISAFGPRLAFYEYDAATSILTPFMILPDPVVLNDIAPADRWNYDILEDNGIAQMRRVAQDVKDMCQALGD